MVVVVVIVVVVVRMRMKDAMSWAVTGGQGNVVSRCHVEFR